MPTDPVVVTTTFAAGDIVYLKSSQVAMTIRWANSWVACCQWFVGTGELTCAEFWLTQLTKDKPK